MSKVTSLGLVDTIEEQAREGFKNHGRGLVACMENTKGKIESVIFIPSADIAELFAEHLLDPGFVRWIETYDTDREYILMDIVQLDSIEGTAEPHLCLYRNRTTVSA